jgi:hypothetical protein
VAESQDGFIDTGITDDWLGRFYICAPCVIEMARAWDMKTFDEVADLDLEVIDVRGRLADALGELTALANVRAAVRAMIKEDASEPVVASGGVRRNAGGGRPRRTAGRGTESAGAPEVR